MEGEGCGHGGSCEVELSFELFKGELVRMSVFSSFCLILSMILFTQSGVFILYGGGVDCVQLESRGFT